MKEDVLNAVSNKLFGDINRVKAVVHQCEARIANKEYVNCAELLQSLGVQFTSFELEIFESVN